MKNKIIIISILLSVLASVGFVSASNVKSYFKFQKGWNLVYGFISPDRLSGGEVLPENIKAIYILKQPTQEYVRLYPKPETKKLEGIDDDYYEKTAQWVYSDKAGSSEYMFEEALPPRYWNEHQIYKGWNIIGITSYMKNYSLSEIKGNCAIEKVYHFESLVQGWSPNLVNNNFMDEKLTNDSVGLGLVIKVSNNCNLGIAEEISAPPQIPN